MPRLSRVSCITSYHISLILAICGPEYHIAISTSVTHVLTLCGPEYHLSHVITLCGPDQHVSSILPSEDKVSHVYLVTI